MKINKKLILIVVVLLLIIFGISCYFIKKNKADNINYKQSDINAVASLEDEIKENTIWVGTFNIIWNDLKNDIVGKDIVFDDMNDTARNLNKATFTVKELSENSYYKTYGYQTIELKEKIEKVLKDKFNETSDILDGFDWNSPDSLFIYTMLKKEFAFDKEFDIFKNRKFKDIDNVTYFGIDSESNDKLKDQVEVLYYKNDSEFAVKLKTKHKDEIILSRGINGKSFIDVYNNIKKLNKDFDGNSNLEENEKLLVPNIDVKYRTSFPDVENKSFLDKNGKSGFISGTIQTINFELNNKGGKVKSEAAMSYSTTAMTDTPRPRNFILNDSFMIFLKEKDKELPYLASYITDITKFNNGEK